MPSLKSHLVAFVIKHTRKNAFTSAEGLHRWIAWSRKVQDWRPSARILTRLSVTERKVSGFPVYDVAPKKPGPLHILYFHGGAYVFEITKYHWALIAEMAERLAARITVPIYPLAPEHDFHDMFGMVSEVYRAVLSETSVENLVFMGDSAGGTMAVVLTMMAREEGLPGPSRLVLISPGLDMSLANPEIYAMERIDPWLGIPGGMEAMRLYCAGIPSTDWRISPLHGDLTALPPTLLLAGTRDLLYPDSKLFAERARKAGVNVELVLEPGMFHVWPLIDMPEARKARDRIVAFLKAKTDRSP